MLIAQRPDLFWGFVASMYVGNVVLLILNLPLVGLFVSLLRIPYFNIIRDQFRDAAIPCFQKFNFHKTFRIVYQSS